MLEDTDKLFTETIENGLKEMNIELPKEAMNSFLRHWDFIRKKNSEMNLTAIRSSEDAARLHFLDSLAVLKAVPLNGRSLIDVGTGAGFPGIPLRVAVPGLDLTLLDATEKKTTFLEELCKELKLSAVKFVCARAEELGRLKQHREQYDYASARGVARLSTLCELCLPLVKPGGAFIAMKGAGWAEEAEEAVNAVSLLGGKIENTADYRIPFGNESRRIIIIRKIYPSPFEYPRRFSRIKKAPL